MTKRILTQLVVWFLLGMASAYFRSFALCVFAGILWYVMGFYVQYRKSDWKKKQSKTTYVFFFVMYLLLCLVVGGMGFLRFHQQQKQIKEIESHLKNNHHITVIGKIYKKEVKNKSILYYLKNSKYFQNQQEKKCNQILVDLTFDSYLIGDTIVVKGDCESFSVARNEGSFHEKNYYYSKNILFRMKAGEIQLLKRESFSWKENLYQLRKKISHIYQVLLPEQEAGILSVMTLGEKSFLDREIKELYQDSGISHVLAISGVLNHVFGYFNSA